MRREHKAPEGNIFTGFFVLQVILAINERGSYKTLSAMCLLGYLFVWFFLPNIDEMRGSHFF